MVDKNIPLAQNNTFTWQSDITQAAYYVEGRKTSANFRVNGVNCKKFRQGDRNMDQDENDRTLNPQEKKVFSGIMVSIVVIALLIIGVKLVENTGNHSTSSNLNTTTTAQPEASKEKDYQEGISQITDKQWLSASMAMESLQKENYKDSAALYNYAMARKYYSEDFMGTGIIERIQEHLKPVQNSLDKIDLNYSGLFAQDIASFKSEIESKQQKLQADLEASNKALDEENKITPGCRKLRIGMGQADAEISMGKPYDINRTVGAYGTHEQWCYNGGVYLYFEDGVLSSWQD